MAWWQEDIAAARRFYEEALAIERRLGDPARTADALYNQAFVVAAEGDFEGAFRLFEESLELFRRAGDEAGAARADWMMAIRDLVAGRWDGPVAKAQEAVDTWRRTGERFRLGDGLVWLAVVYGRPAARPTPRRPWRRPGRCSTTPTARWACSRSCSACPTWPDGRSATRTRCGWPGPRTPSATRSVGAPPSTSWPGSLATRRPRPAPTSRPMSPSGPGGRARTSGVDAASTFLGPEPAG
ncbi:MAG TPA: tetratricopeptide repeat protein [Actinomycetes bacterium]|nr:tetratricopeptide repeat protein [Actinomycetes bacterium]